MGTMFREVLSPQERLAAWRLGAYIKFADAGIVPSQVDASVKQAASPVSAASTMLSPTGMAKAIATVAVLTGVPLGVAAHIIGKRVNQSRGREDELEAQVGYYHNAAKQLEGGLAAANTKM